MNSPAEIIRQVLLDLDLVEQVGESDVDWTGYVAFLPEKPANAVCVYDTSPKPDGRIISTGERIEHPGIQVRVRGPVYPEVWNKAQEIATALDEQSNLTVDMESQETWVLQNFSRTGTILYAGIDEVGSRRYHNFTVNGTVTLELD